MASKIPLSVQQQNQYKLQIQKARYEIQVLKQKIYQLRKEKSNYSKSYLRTEYVKRIEEEIAESLVLNSVSPLTPDKSDNKSDNMNISSSGNGNGANNSNNKIKPATLRDKLSKKFHLREYSKLEGHGNKVYGCDWNPALTGNNLDMNNPTNTNNSSELVSVGRDGKLIFWNALTGHKRLAYPLDTEFIMTLKYSPDGNFVACGGLDDTLSLFPVRYDINGICNDIYQRMKTYRYHTGYISSIQYSDNNNVITSSGDGSIIVWDIELFSKTNIPKSIYKLHRGDVMGISINPKHPYLLLSGSVDSTVKIIDLRVKYNNNNDDNSNNNDFKDNSLCLNNFGYKSPCITHSFSMLSDPIAVKRRRSTDVNVVKWFPDGETFVAGCDDGTVRLYDTRSCYILNEYSYSKHALGNTGGTTTNMLSQTIIFNNVNSDNIRSNPKYTNSVVRTTTNTADDADIVNVNDRDIDDDDDDIDIDQKHQEQELEMGLFNKDNIIESSDDDSYEDESDGVATLDFSKSGAYMFVSYNNDQHKVFVWNLLTGDVEQELSHDGHVPCLAISPSGDALAAACWDHNLKLWK